ncbi:hypothetical protein C4573_04240 [Candidatus Woesearchaeota archaeon]|nr:MAG: hypothetical protein C4573_04240 [Candidatus Woesearchaeota archaeon]
MPSIKSICDTIRVHVTAVRELIDEAPEKYKKVIVASAKATSLVVGLLPGGAIISMVEAFKSANEAKKSIKEAHSALRGIPPEEHQRQLEKLREETDLEIHNLKTIARAEETEREVLQYIHVRIIDALHTEHKAMALLEKDEVGEILELTQQTVKDASGNIGNIRPDSIIAMIHMELKQFNIVIQELQNIQAIPVIRPVQLAFQRLIQTRQLLKERVMLLQAQQEIDQTVEAEKTDFYDIQNAKNIFQAQLKVFIEHKAALESLLKDALTLSGRTRQLRMMLIDKSYFEELNALRKRHEEINEKLLRSLLHIKEQFIRE